MSDEKLPVLPTCRVIGGSVYVPKQNIRDGKPVLGKDGQPSMIYNFGVAVPKDVPGFRENDRSWASTSWGSVIWRVGHEAWQALADSPSFAWKIKDGDSPYPNENGVVPNTLEGYPGHWVIWFNTQIKPVICTVHGETIPDGHPDSVYPGCWVQVQFSVEGNKPNANRAQHKAGVYLNPWCVAFTAHGLPIKAATHVDPKAAGFAAPSHLPPGASVTPVGGQFNPAPPAAAPQYQAPAAPQYQAPPQPPMPPPPQNGRVMTALAQYPYETYIAASWTDDQLRANGLML